MKTNQLVEVKNRQAVTTSQLIAAKFNKRHSDLVRSISNLILANAKLRSLYQSTSYVDEQGKKRPLYIMGRDGFTLLVMGFTGQQALDFKLDYINAFNEMEKSLVEIKKVGVVSKKLYEKQKEQVAYWRSIAERSIKSMEAMSESFKQHQIGIRPAKLYRLTDEYYNVLFVSFKMWLECENTGSFMPEIRDRKLLTRIEAARTLYQNSNPVPFNVMLQPCNF